MVKLSNTQLISVWLITLNSFGMNLVMMLKGLKNERIPEVEYQKSQMEKLLEKSIVKVAIYKDNAYWVLNNVIYKAKIDQNGNILDQEAEEVDVFKLSDREVNNLLVILDSMKR